VGWVPPLGLLDEGVTACCCSERVARCSDNQPPPPSTTTTQPRLPCKTQRLMTHTCAGREPERAAGGALAAPVGGRGGPGGGGATTRAERPGALVGLPLSAFAWWISEIVWFWEVGCMGALLFSASLQPCSSPCKAADCPTNQHSHLIPTRLRHQQVQQYGGGVLTALELTSLDLGPAPPRLSAIKTYNAASDEQVWGVGWGVGGWGWGVFGESWGACFCLFGWVGIGLRVATCQQCQQNRAAAKAELIAAATTMVNGAALLH